MLGAIILLVFIIGGAFLLGLRSRVSERVGEDTREGAAVMQESREAPVVFPIAEYASRRRVNAFGEDSQVTLNGYHAGDDIEYTDARVEVSVFAIADGVVMRNDWVKGYGGVMVIAHTIEGKEFGAIYGHIDLSSVSLKAGDRVSKGQQIAHLGEGGTPETDGERKHLHFAVYEGEDSRIQGYESRAAQLESWRNPSDFFGQYGLDTKTPARVYNPQEDRGGNEFALEFFIPEGWEVEYDESSRIINLFTLSGKGLARERSQILFTYFDASQFLTLSTVTIREVSDHIVGREGYTAKRYDIEKRPEVLAFPGQPSWRNERHIAIDFRNQEGRTRYYSIAKNPELDEEVFERVLESIVMAQ